MHLVICTQCGGHNAVADITKYQCKDCGARPSAILIPASSKAERFAQLGKALRSKSIRLPPTDRFVEDLANFPASQVGWASTPAHVVTWGDNCNGEGHDMEADTMSAHVAHKVYQAFGLAWWVSVRRAGPKFKVKVRHDYPEEIDLRVVLHDWLPHFIPGLHPHAYFELQTKRESPPEG